MFSTTTSSVSYFAKEEKLRAKYKKKCLEIRQGANNLDNLWDIFLQGFQMLEKYKYKFPDTIAECAVDLVETYKLIFQRCITSRDSEKYEEIFYQITPHLAQLLSTEAHIMHYRSELLNLWSEIVSNRSNKYKKTTFLEQTESVIIVIINCIFFTGNYFTQLNGLELVLKYIKSVDRSVQICVLNEIMPNNELRDILLDFRLTNFDEDSRTFLNIFNMKISDEVPVYSIVASSGDFGTLVIRKPMLSEKFQQPLWIDFNSLKHTVSFFCENKTFFPEYKSRFDNKKKWVLVEIAVDKITLKEEQSLIHIKTAEKIRLVPPSFEDDIRFNLEEINEVTLQFSHKNLILIKEAKIIDFMNSKKNIENSQTEKIGFNIFHQFKEQKQVQKPKEKASCKRLCSKQIPVESEKAEISENVAENIYNIHNNMTTPNILINDNENFSNLKSSIVIPETTISFNSIPTSKVIPENNNKKCHEDEKICKVNQRKHMSRRESFETTFSKCFVKLPMLKSSTVRTAKTTEIQNSKTKINKEDKADKDTEDNTLGLEDTNLKPSRYRLRSFSKPRNKRNEENQIDNNKKRSKKINKIRNKSIKKIIKNVEPDKAVNEKTRNGKLTQNKVYEHKIGLGCEFPTIEMGGEKTDFNSNNESTKLIDIQQETNSNINKEYLDYQPKVASSSIVLEVDKNKNRKRKLYSVNQIIEQPVEIHQSPKTKDRHIEDRVTTKDLKNNSQTRVVTKNLTNMSSLRLVNMVRPLAKDKKNPLVDVNTTSIVPSTLLNVDTEQLNDTVEEYAKNYGYVGITNKLKQKKNRVIYTPEELDNVFDNLIEIDSSLQRTTKKFFKTSGPERNVYDVETILKGAPQRPCKKKRENSTKRRTDDTSKHIPNLVGENKNVQYSYKQNIEKECEDIKMYDSRQDLSVQMKNKNTNDNNTQPIGNSQVYDLVVEDFTKVKKKSKKELNKEKSDIEFLEVSKKINNQRRTLLDETLLHQPSAISDKEKYEESPLLIENGLHKKTNIIISNVTANTEHNSKKIKNAQQKRKTKVSLDKTKSAQQMQKPRIQNKIDIQKNDNKNNLEKPDQQDLKLKTLVNNTEEESFKKTNLSFSQKVRNFEELLESHKKSRQENKNSVKSHNICNKYQNISPESLTQTDSNKLIINTSIATPNNLHSPINSNFNKFDDLMTEDEDEPGNNLILKSNKIENNDNEITITPNERCDKTWLYEKFLNDIDSENNNTKRTQNFSSNDSDLSIEPTRHAEPKYSELPEINFNNLTFTKKDTIIKDDEDYPNDSVSAILEKENNNDNLTPIVPGQGNKENIIQFWNQSNNKSIDKESSTYNGLQHDSSWRSNTSTKCTSILPKTNKNIEITETRTKTIRIKNNNRIEERRVSVKRRFENNSDQLTEEDVNGPSNVFKQELYKITNNFSTKYDKFCKYPNEVNLQKDIEQFSEKYEQITREYVKSSKRMQNLRKKLKLEENNCINTLINAIDMIDKHAHQLQHKKEYFDNNVGKNKRKFKQLLCNFKDSVYEVRNKIWNNHMDSFVQGFVENMKKFYTCDEE